MTITSHPHPRRTRVLAAALLTAGLAVGGTTAAQAHVHVSADSTASGSFSALTFRVPNESDTTSTVKVSVDLPQDTPLLYVSTKPVPGWTATTTEAPLPKPVESSGTTITKAIRTVTWTADKASAIGPGQYQEFAISAGPLPAEGTLELPATQTYSDGKIVKWDEPAPEGGAEPEHPAPALVLTAAAGDEHAQASTPAQPEASAQMTKTAASSDSAARGLAGGALAVALAALLTAIVSFRRKAVPAS